jgi:hypothetical protein
LRMRQLRGPLEHDTESVQKTVPSRPLLPGQPAAVPCRARVTGATFLAHVPAMPTHVRAEVGVSVYAPMPFLPCLDSDTTLQRKHIPATALAQGTQLPVWWRASWRTRGARATPDAGCC